MEVYLTEQEHEYLLAVLDAGLRDQRTQLPHLLAIDQKRYMERQIGLVEGLKSKLLPVEVG